MPIVIDQAKSFCHDCNEEIEGGFTLNLAQFGFYSPVGLVCGDLVIKNSEHHDKNRQFSSDPEINQRLPKHDHFTVMLGDRVLGEMRGAATFAREVTFVIEDEDLIKKFYDEIRAEQRKHHFGPERYSY